MQSLGKGSCHLKQCDLTNTPYVPDFSQNLLSINAITQNDGTVIFSKNKVQILKNDEIILQGDRTRNRLYMESGTGFLG